MIKTIKNFIQVPGRPIAYTYITRDGKPFSDLDEAVEHENSLTPEKRPIVYEQIWSIQEAINKAIAENRVVRFLWNGSNKDIKKGIIDKKDCRIMKPEKDSNDVAVIPPGIEDFDFGDVDLSIQLPSRVN
jgi:hypothetical protein